MMSRESVAGIACSFLVMYYRDFVKEREVIGLVDFYSDASHITYADCNEENPEVAQGKHAIAQHLAKMDAALGRRKVEVRFVDYIPLPGGSIHIVCQGLLYLRGQRRTFFQVFVLAPTPYRSNTYYIASDYFRVMVVEVEQIPENRIIMTPAQVAQHLLEEHERRRMMEESRERLRQQQAAMEALRQQQNEEAARRRETQPVQREPDTYCPQNEVYGVNNRHSSNINNNNNNNNRDRWDRHTRDDGSKFSEQNGNNKNGGSHRDRAARNDNRRVERNEGRHEERNGERRRERRERHDTKRVENNGTAASNENGAPIQPRHARFPRQREQLPSDYIPAPASFSTAAPAAAKQENFGTTINRPVPRSKAALEKRAGTKEEDNAANGIKETASASQRPANNTAAAPTSEKRVVKAPMPTTRTGKTEFIRLVSVPQAVKLSDIEDAVKGVLNEKPVDAFWFGRTSADCVLRLSSSSLVEQLLRDSISVMDSKLRVVAFYL